MVTQMEFNGFSAKTGDTTELILRTPAGNIVLYAVKTEDGVQFGTVIRDGNELDDRVKDLFGGAVRAKGTPNTVDCCAFTDNGIACWHKNSRFEEEQNDGVSEV